MNMKITASAFILLFAGLLFMSCGYSLVGMGNYLPPDIKVIRVDMIENLTFKYGLESEITNAIIDRLSRASNLTVVNTGDADAVIMGRIKTYKMTPIEIDQGGYARKYQITLSMQLNLIRVETSEKIWGDDNLFFYKDLEVSRSITDSLELENEALIDLSEEIADRVVMSMLMNF